jgi:hypothetical protein
MKALMGPHAPRKARQALRRAPRCVGQISAKRDYGGPPLDRPSISSLRLGYRRLGGFPPARIIGDRLGGDLRADHFASNTAS